MVYFLKEKFIIFSLLIDKEKPHLLQRCGELLNEARVICTRGQINPEAKCLEKGQKHKEQHQDIL